jgi:hypothetical protein
MIIKATEANGKVEEANLERRRRCVLFQEVVMSEG